MVRPRVRAKSSWAACALALALGAAAPPATASPLENANGTAVFTGPAHPHASAIYLNPAALGLTRPGQHFYLGGAARLDFAHIHRRVLSADSQTLSPGPTVRDRALSPQGMLAFYASVGDRGYFGAAIHTPFWEEFFAAEAIGYHTVGGSFWQTLFSLAGSYRASSRLHFGLGLSVGFSHLELDFLRDTALEAGSAGPRGINGDCGGSMPCGHENPAATQRISLDARTRSLRELFSTRNLALSAGIIIRPTDAWWIGIGYVSPPGVISALEIRGRAEVEAAPRDGSSRTTGRTEINFKMPQTLQVGARGPGFPGYDLTLAVRWQNYSRQNAFDLRMFGPNLAAQNDVPEWIERYRGFTDLWRAEAGVESSEGSRFRFGARFRFESGATSPATTTPLQMHGWSGALVGGAEYRIAETLVVTAGYDVAWFPATGGNDSAFDPRDRLACVDSNFDFNACAAAREGRALPTAAGEYNKLSHTLSLSVRYDRL